MVKELIMQVVKDLPDDITVEDFIEALYLRVKVQKALDDAKNNRVYTTEEIKKEMAK